MTVLSTKEDAEREYCIVFKQKSGNNWEDKDRFERKPKKYKIVAMEKESEKSLIKDFYQEKSEVDYPETSLSTKIHTLVKDITTLKIYSS